MEWITALYARHFTKVPLVINYHRMLGDTYQDSWQETVPPDAEPLLNIVRLQIQHLISDCKRYL